MHELGLPNVHKKSMACTDASMPSVEGRVDDARRDSNRREALILHTPSTDTPTLGIMSWLLFGQQSTRKK